VAVGLRLRTGGGVGHRTTACLISCVITPSRWFGSTTQTLVRRWRRRSWASVMMCGCRERRCAAGCGGAGTGGPRGERHDVGVSRETLRGWMRRAGIWLPRAERRRIQQPRHRREHVGELIQIDGSDHRWFEDRGAPCTLLVFIDDATSRLMELRFVPSESTFAYFETLKSYLQHHGKPVAFYSA